MQPARFRFFSSASRRSDIMGTTLDDPVGESLEELDPIDTVLAEIEEFARASRGECAFEITGEVALRSVAVLEAGLRSATEKREVTIDEVMG